MRALASALLILTGLAHAAQYVRLDGAPGPLFALFAAAYFAIGMSLRRPGRWALWAGAILPAIGGLGGSAQLRAAFDPVLAAFVAIDVAVVISCALALRAKPAEGGAG
jgi:hypothetical protein